MREPPLLTVIIGAKCSNGVALVADRKLTNIFGGKPEFRDKIFGDLGHFLMGYTGLEGLFDIFRKSVVGDVQLMLKKDPYTFDNFVSRCAPPINLLNGIASRPDYYLEILIAKHLWKDSELHHIDANGKYNKVEYMAIGSGKEVANAFCQSLQFDKVTMKEFVQQAYLAIMYMDQYCPGLGVGVGPDGIPRIKYLNYDDEWDREPTTDEIEEYKQYTKKQLEHFKEAFDAMKK